MNEIDFIKANCGKTLNDYRNLHSFMMKYGTREDVYLRTSFIRPKKYGSNDATEELSQLMKQDGFAATRAEGIFCFSEKYRSYWKNTFQGSQNAYVLFPSDNMSITYADTSNSEFQDLGDDKWISIAAGHYGFKPRELAAYPKKAAELFWELFRDVFTEALNFSEVVNVQNELIVLPESCVFVPMKEVYLLEELLGEWVFEKLS